MLFQFSVRYRPQYQVKCMLVASDILHETLRQLLTIRFISFHRRRAIAAAAAPCKRRRSAGERDRPGSVGNDPVPVSFQLEHENVGTRWKWHGVCSQVKPRRYRR